MCSQRRLDRLIGVSSSEWKKKTNLFPLSFRGSVADVAFKVSARPRETMSGVEKKGDFLSLLIKKKKKKSDVIMQSEMLLYSLMELEFELPVFAHVGDASQPPERR